jgi:hypothetical protein
VNTRFIIYAQGNISQWDILCSGMSADSVKRNDGLQKGESNMKENEIKCVLCGLSVEINGFTVNTTEGLKLFCCAGCVSVYRLLNGDKLLD